MDSCTVRPAFPAPRHSSFIPWPSAAFTITEILVVIAIIVVMGGLAIPAFQSLSPAQKLSSSGARIASLVEQARQNAMGKRTPTALVVLTNSGTDADYRTFSAFEYTSVAPNGTISADGTSQWRQVSKWERLPQGIVIDPDTSNSTFLQSPSLLNAASLTNAYTPMKLGNQTLSTSSYGFQVFLPGGRLQAPPVSPPKLRLRVGVMNSGVLTATQPNTYDLIINEATGRTKEVRP